MQNLFLYRKDYINPGDIWSSPINYLGDNWRGLELDVDNFYQIENANFDNVIVGGGAIFTVGDWIIQIQKLLESMQFKNLIFWGTGRGLGYNFPYIKFTPTLCGGRDYEPDYLPHVNEWVPCASVMHPLIEKYVNQKHTKDFLVLNHWKREEILFPAEHTKLSNKPQSIERMLEVIAAHKWILTTSYHAAYWATLLNKRVIVLQVDDPNSKFRAFKHPPVIAKKFNWELITEAKNYPEAYEECRDVNLRFRDKVYSL